MIIAIPEDKQGHLAVVLREFIPYFFPAIKKETSIKLAKTLMLNNFAMVCSHSEGQTHLYVKGCERKQK